MYNQKIVFIYLTLTVLLFTAPIVFAGTGMGETCLYSQSKSDVRLHHMTRQPMNVVHVDSKTGKVTYGLDGKRTQGSETLRE